MNRPVCDISGIGLGLRFEHIPEILSTNPAIPWFEVLTDNFFGPGGLALTQLERIRERYPITLHSVGMSVGSTDPIDLEYLRKVKLLVDRFEPALVSEHLCWTSVHGHAVHDLLPLPYNEETVNHVAQRVLHIQEILGRRILLENVSTYFTFEASTMDESEFVIAVAKAADCHLLVDLNNVYVNSRNNGLDAQKFINELPKNIVKQLHLGGAEDLGTHLIDSHGSEISEPVWQLFREFIAFHGDTPALIEWDNDIPALDVLNAEAVKAEGIRREVARHT